MTRATRHIEERLAEVQRRTRERQLRREIREGGDGGWGEDGRKRLWSDSSVSSSLSGLSSGRRRTTSSDGVDTSKPVAWPSTRHSSDTRGLTAPRLAANSTAYARLSPRPPPKQLNLASPAYAERRFSAISEEQGFVSCEEELSESGLGTSEEDSEEEEGSQEGSEATARGEGEEKESSSPASRSDASAEEDGHGTWCSTLGHNGLDPLY
jgi:hypothetical protein